MLRRAAIAGALLLTVSCAPKSTRIGSAEVTSAEMRSSSPEPKRIDDRWAKAVAIYGRARALRAAGSCAEAKAAYDEYASFVRPFNAPAADMALDYAKDCRPHEPIADGAMNQMVTNVMTEHDAEALKVGANIGAPASDDGWLDYNRARALAGLSQPKEAIVAYRVAEARFGTKNPHGRAIAIYGRALALENLGRCPEAKNAYEEFASLVRPTDPREATMAMAAGRACGHAP